MGCVIQTAQFKDARLKAILLLLLLHATSAFFAFGLTAKLSTKALEDIFDLNGIIRHI
jgi:hypothetical protein